MLKVELFHLCHRAGFFLNLQYLVRFRESCEACAWKRAPARAFKIEGSFVIGCPSAAVNDGIW